MDQSNPDTIQMEDDPSLWQATQVDDVFLPSVRVTLGWADVEKAVERGAVVPAQAHSLWAAWAAPGSPLRKAATAAPVVTEFHSTISDFPPIPEPREAAPSLAVRLGGPLAGLVVGALLMWVAKGS